MRSALMENDIVEQQNGLGWIERVSEGLIYFLIIFTPWAFGSTEEWAMRIANVAGYTLGGLLLLKWGIRWIARRDEVRDEGLGYTLRLMGALTVGLLGYVLISAVNARATYDWASNTFFYNDQYIPWLPYSYDANATWAAFWNYLAWAAVFWAMRDWLMGGGGGRKTEDGRQRTDDGRAIEDVGGRTEDGGRAGGDFAMTDSPTCVGCPSAEMTEGKASMPVGKPALRNASVPVGKPALRNRESPSSVVRPPSSRLHRLLWVLAINGAVLALEGLLQQTTGTNKLLWIRDTFYNRAAEAQFGPFPYRANGSQYINLIWPVTLGFWWWLQRGGGIRRRHQMHHALLACVLIMMAIPIVSLSRGGALVAVGMAALGSGVFIVSRSPGLGWMQKLGIVLFLGGSLLAGANVVWDKLEKRMREFGASYAQRERIYEVAGKMTQDFPWFGTGAETFQPLYQLYRVKADEYWPGQVHNDWLETRITFGWIGFSMILSALGVTWLHWSVARDGIAVSWRFVSFFWIAMLGCLIHARWDLPFQVYSIVLLFLVYGSVLLCVRRR